jgi:hypothetical protein
MRSEDKSICVIVIVCVGGAPPVSRPGEPLAVKWDLRRLSTEDLGQVTTVAKVFRLRLPLSYVAAGPSPLIEGNPVRDKTIPMVVPGCLAKES